MKKLKEIGLVLVAAIVVVFSTSFDHANNELLSKVLNRLTAFGSVKPTQKVYVHYDKPAYITNEVVNLNAYILEGPSMQLSKEGILYLELLDPSNRPVDQQKLKYLNGRVSGTIQLADTLNSGQYYICAYTNWMKNFDNGLLFKKPIRVYSEKKQDYYSSPDPGTKLDVQFFPEGGNLILNIPSKVAISIKDEAGNGVQASGLLLNDQDTSSVSFETDRNGVGVFSIKPKKDVRHFVKIKGAGTDYVLPELKESGHVIQVENSAGDVKVTVRNRSAKGGKLLLVAQAGNRIYFSAEGNSRSRGFVAYMPKKDLPTGLIQLVLINEEEKMVSERLIYVDERQLDPVQLDIKKEVVKTREKVEIQLNGDPSLLSLSVNDSLSSIEGMWSYLLFTSEIPQYIDRAQDYLKKTPASRQALDNFLLTQKWVRFDWNDLLANGTKSPEFYLETDMNIKGQLVNINGDVLPNFDIALSVPEDLVTYQAKSDSVGRVDAYLFEYIGGKQIFVQPFKEFDLWNQVTLKVESDFIEHQPMKVVREEFTDEKTKSAVQSLYDTQRIIDAYNIKFREDSTSFSIAPKALIEDNYEALYSDEVVLAEYIDFPNMREVFREIVPEVQIPLNSNNIRVFSKEMSDSFKGPPLFFVDGVPTNNIEYILDINPADVSSIGTISIFKNLDHFGHAGKYGVIAINSKKGRQLKNIPQPPNIFYSSGLSMSSKYYYPSYRQEKNSRVPDFRSVMYWDPYIEIGSRRKTLVDFYVSDESGEYQIAVQGISRDGVPFYLTRTLSVN